MPYKAFKRGDQWCVYKHDSQGRAIGDDLGCHDTKAEADRQIAALYAREEKPMAEKVMKTVNGEQLPASAFLVVDDPESPSTWHLQVRGADGKPDHRLMGAAWAALHGGYRGNKYEGPNKAAAIAALKKLYDAEEMVTPSEETSKEGTSMTESLLQEHATLKARALGLSKALKELLDEKTLPRVIRRQMENLRTSLRKTWKDLENEASWERETAQENDSGMAIPIEMFGGVSSFADLKAARMATKYAYDIRSISEDFQVLVANILENNEISDKGEAILALAEEFVSELAALQPATSENETMTEANLNATNAAEPLTETASKTETFVQEKSTSEPVSETQEKMPVQVEILIEDGTPMQSTNIAEHATILEATPLADGINRRGPIKIKTAFITEGWGNERDGHYYPSETLQASAELFRDAKMYLTDHVQAEKNVKTEAAFIASVDGFVQGQGLVGNVVVYDPDFAEKVRNLADVGRLDLLECSIYAEGETQAAKIGEREGKVVKRITRVHSVDWVTRAGAGGHAMHLAETAAPNTMKGKGVMEKAKIVELLAATRLPKAAQALLAEREYADENAVNEAVTQFVEQWKAETGGGEPFAQGAGQESKRGRTLEEHAAAVTALYKQAGLLISE